MKTFLLALLLAPSLALASTSNLREISEPELEAMVKKLVAGLAKCSHKSPDDQVVATVTNSTDEFIDKTKLAIWIRDGLKPVKSVPEIAPFYEVRAKLSAEKSQKKKAYKAVYTLHADVFQDDKKICEKSETLQKSGDIE